MEIEPTEPVGLPCLPDGTSYYGRLGEVAYDPGQDKVQCHICGQWLKRIGGGHLSLKHPEWTMTSYRQAFGLKRSQTLIAAGTRNALRGNAVGRLQDGKLGSPLGGGHGLQQDHWSSLAERRPDLAAEVHPTRNGNLEESSLGVWSTEKIWWLCSRCAHEWQAPVFTRASVGTGCPACGPRADHHKAQRGSKQNLASLAIRRPDLANELHPTRNGDLNAERLRPWSKRRVWWQCSACGHEWEALVMNRHQGNGCPRCAPAKRAATYRERRETQLGDENATKRRRPPG